MTWVTSHMGCIKSLLTKKLLKYFNTADEPKCKSKTTPFMAVLHLFPKLIENIFFKQNIIAEHEIRNISCAAQDPEDLSTFAYITKDLKTNHHYCHVFTAFDVVSL